MVQHVLNELDLVGDLGTTEDGKERSLGALEDLRKVLELLLHEETGGSLGELNADHRGVGSVGGSEAVVRNVLSRSKRSRADSRVVDVDCAKSGEVLTELLNLGRVGLDLLVALLALALLLDVESQVLKEEDLAVLAGENSLLDVLSDTVVEEGDFASEKFRKLGGDGLEGVLWVGGSVGSAEVGHENDRLGSVVKGVLDGWDGSGDTLGLDRRCSKTYGRVSDLELLVHAAMSCERGTDSRNVEVDTDEDTLALELEVGDAELGG